MGQFSPNEDNCYAKLNCLCHILDLRLRFVVFGLTFLTNEVQFKLEKQLILGEIQIIY